MDIIPINTPPAAMSPVLGIALRALFFSKAMLKSDAVPATSAAASMNLKMMVRRRINLRTRALCCHFFI